MRKTIGAAKKHLQRNCRMCRCALCCPQNGPGCSLHIQILNTVHARFEYVFKYLLLFIGKIYIDSKIYNIFEFKERR